MIFRKMKNKEHYFYTSHSEVRFGIKISFSIFKEIVIKLIYQNISGSLTA